MIEDYMRRHIERAIEEATRPRGMSPHAGMAKIDASILQRLLVMALNAPTPPAQPCRTDGRCQYAIDHGADGMGHCPPGECCMPVQQDNEALEPDMQSAWISVQDRMPPDDTPVLVYVPGNEMLAFAIDQWQMQREAPLGWSSATIETGMGWGDHDYEDVSHWMPLTAPGHPLDPDDQGIVDGYDALLRQIDEAIGGNDDR